MDLQLAKLFHIFKKVINIAYSQLILYLESRYITVFRTHLALYQSNRLCVCVCVNAANEKKYKTVFSGLIDS